MKLRKKGFDLQEHNYDFVNIRQKQWLKILNKAKNVPCSIDETNITTCKKYYANETALDVVECLKYLVAKEGEACSKRFAKENNKLIIRYCDIFMLEITSFYSHRRICEKFYWDREHIEKSSSAGNFGPASSFK